MRADGWMDGWLAVKIMLNLRVTDPLIGLVLPPQIHLFPLAGDGVKRRLQHACTCAALRPICRMERGKRRSV